MNREIKFRCWVDNMSIKEMHYSNEIEINSADAMSLQWKVGFIDAYPEKNDITNWQKEIKWMQFTGLTDKNGKEIYEGDIVITQEYSDKPHSRTRKKKRHIGAVVFSIGGSGGFYNKEENEFNRHVQYSAKWTVEIKEYGKFGCSCWGAFFDCEVVGNIYQNPELLTK